MPSLSSWSSGAQKGTWTPKDLPDIPIDLIIERWEEKTSGSHGSIRKAKVRHAGLDSYVCIKLFTEEWKAEYQREAKAYALLAYRGVRRCIPDVYWKGAMPLAWWNGDKNALSDSNEIRYGLVMEWLDVDHEVDFATLDIRTAEVLGHAIDQIHTAKVLHDDLQEGNILLVRESGKLRLVIIDFSCCWLNPHRDRLEEEYQDFLGSLIHKMVQRLVNVLTIRIAAFSPMKYSTRNSTDLLHVFRGITSRIVPPFLKRDMNCRQSANRPKRA